MMVLNNDNLKSVEAYVVTKFNKDEAESSF